SAQDTFDFLPLYCMTRHYSISRSLRIITLLLGIALLQQSVAWVSFANERHNLPKVENGLVTLISWATNTPTDPYLDNTNHDSDYPEPQEKDSEEDALEKETKEVTDHHIQLMWAQHRDNVRCFLHHISEHSEPDFTVSTPPPELS
ncbi:MAG: hypothetical protein KDD36_04135, partial [Flavobacteriales bacterium]|nr:hypothetical protein [Flavobacteriales bacterium]